MEENKVTSFITSSKDKLPANKVLYVTEKLKNADNSKFDTLMTIELKNPVIGLILSLFLGQLGIDRFYSGDIGKGVLKLLTLGACGIWTIVDWFLIMNSIKEKNLNEIMLII